jgi:hypothetical protein
LAILAAAAFDVDGVARYLAVGVGDSVTRALACGFAGTGREAHAATTIAQLDGHAHAATLALVGAALAGGVLRGEQVDLVVCLQAGGACGLDAGALYREVAVFTGACGLNGDVAACVDAGASGVVGAGALFGLAAAGAHAEADANASGFVCGVALFGFRCAVCVGLGGAVWVLCTRSHHAVGIALSSLERVCGLFEVERGVGPSQRLHAATAGVACGLQLAAGRLQGREHGAGDGQGQPALLELLFGALAAGFARFVDVHFLGGDGGVATRGEHVTAGLGVGPACGDGHAAAATGGAKA